MKNGYFTFYFKYTIVYHRIGKKQTDFSETGIGFFPICIAGVEDSAFYELHIDIPNLVVVKWGQ